MDKGAPIRMLERNLPPRRHGEEMIGREENQLPLLQRTLARKQFAQMRMFGSEGTEVPFPALFALRFLPLDQPQRDPFGMRGSVAETPGETTHHLGAGLKGQIRIGLQAAQIRVHGTNRDQRARRRAHDNDRGCTAAPAGRFRDYDRRGQALDGHRSYAAGDGSAQTSQHQVRSDNFVPGVVHVRLVKAKCYRHRPSASLGFGEQCARFVFTGESDSVKTAPQTGFGQTMTQPRYLQIKNEILHQLQTGNLQPEDRIPSEHQLCKQFHVSRLTVQRAIRELVSHGLLRRVQGSGTFVTNFTHRFSLIEVRDVVEEIRRLGGEATTEVLLHRRVTPHEDVLKLLELEPGTEVFHVALVQSMDGEPVAYEERFAILDVYPDFLDQDFSKRSVFDYLASRSVLEDVENVVSAALADKRMATMLEIDPTEACVRVQRRNWYKGQCVTLTRITYAGTRQVLASRYRPYETEQGH